MNSPTDPVPERLAQAGFSSAGTSTPHDGDFRVVPGLDPVDAALLLGAARVALGVVANVFPRTLLGTWVGGRMAAQPGAATLGRALGGRDLVIGGAQVHAALRGQNLPGWLYAASVADFVDAAASLALARHRPQRTGALATAAVAGGVGVVQVLLAGRLRRRNRHRPPGEPNPGGPSA